jgi:hypothetical protein
MTKRLGRLILDGRKILPMTYEGDIRDAYSQWLEEVTDYLDRIGEEHSLKWLQFKTNLIYQLVITCMKVINNWKTSELR